MYDFFFQLAGGMKEVTTATQCLTDTFSVTNPSGITHPSICGINTGEHSNTFQEVFRQNLEFSTIFFLYSVC